MSRLLIIKDDIGRIIAVDPSNILSIWQRRGIFFKKVTMMTTREGNEAVDWVLDIDILRLISTINNAR